MDVGIGPRQATEKTQFAIRTLDPSPGGICDVQTTSVAQVPTLVSEPTLSSASTPRCVRTLRALELDAGIGKLIATLVRYSAHAKQRFSAPVPTSSGPQNTPEISSPKVTRQVSHLARERPGRPAAAAVTPRCSVLSTPPVRARTRPLQALATSLRALPLGRGCSRQVPDALLIHLVGHRLLGSARRFD